MATNHDRPGSNARQRHVTNLNRHPIQHHPSSGASLIHYALDLESPPLIACDAPDNPPSTTIAMDVTCPDCMTHEEFPRAALVPQITAAMVLREASLLLSEAGENPEYDRAIVELTSALMGAGQDDSILMTRILRSLKQGVCHVAGTVQ